MFQALISSVLLTSVLAAPRPASVPAYGPPEPAYPDEAPVYKYTYAVKDDYSFSNFNAHEERDGYNAAGGYQVALPDGRTQIVTYTATKVSPGGIMDIWKLSPSPNFQSPLGSGCSSPAKKCFEAE